MTWEEYCIKKKIDSKLFKQEDPKKWEELKDIFEQVHPNSFTEQKKFLINDLRRRYHLKEEEAMKQDAKVVTAAKPVFKPQPKPSKEGEAN